MHLVRDPDRAGPVAPAHRPACLGFIGAGLVLAALAGCGGGKPTAQPPPEASGSGAHLSQPISLADCTDWEDGSVDERLGTVRQLRDFAGGPVVGGGGQGGQSGRGAVLDDEKAYDLLENYCGNGFARAFKLYKLYERAAAFAGQPATPP